MIVLVRRTVLELRAHLRAVVSHRGARRGLVGLLAAALVAAMIACATMPIPATSGPHVEATSERIMFGVLVVSTLVGIGATMASAGAALRNGARSRLLSLAPLRGASLTVSLFAPTCVWAGLPYVVFYSPFVVLVARLTPAVALRGAASAVVAFGVAVAAALSAVIALTRALGRHRGAQAATSVGFMLSFVGVMSVGYVVRVAARLPSTPLYFGILLLPAVLYGVARAFERLLRLSSTPPAAPEPRWNRAPYLRLLQRAGGVHGLATCIPLAVVLVMAPSMRHASVACFGISAVISTLERAFAAEIEQPLRFKLAPAAARVRRTMLVAIGGGAALVSFIPAVVVGVHCIRWLAAVAGLLVASVLAFRLESRLLRRGAHVALVILSLASQALV